MGELEARGNDMMTQDSLLTNKDGNVYTYKKEIRCDCGKIVAYRDNDKIYLYCKKCRKQIPILLEPEP